VGSPNEKFDVALGRSYLTSLLADQPQTLKPFRLLRRVLDDLESWSTPLGFPILQLGWELLADAAYRELESALEAGLEEWTFEKDIETITFSGRSSATIDIQMVSLPRSAPPAYTWLFAWDGDTSAPRFWASVPWTPPQLERDQGRPKYRQAFLVQRRNRVEFGCSVEASDCFPAEHEYWGTLVRYPCDLLSFELRFQSDRPARNVSLLTRLGPDRLETREHLFSEPRTRVVVQLPHPGLGNAYLVEWDW